MSNVQFPLVLDAVQKGDRVQWAVGDALIKEIKEVGGAVESTRLRACADMLEEKGFERYDIKLLSHLRMVALNFPRSKRVDDVAWGVHRIAGTPENLTQAISVLRKMKRSVSQRTIEMVMSEWRRKDREEREQEERDARREVERASEAKREAREREVRAATEAERLRAREEKERAKQREEAARQRAAEASSPPKGKGLATKPPEQSDLRLAATASELLATARKVRQMLRANLEHIDGTIDRLDADTRDALAEAHHEIETLASQIVTRFGTKKDRFRTITGGAA